MSKWPMVRLGDVCRIVTGSTPRTSDKSNYLSKDIYFYKPGDFDEGKLNYLDGSIDMVSENAREKVRILPPNSVLVTCIGVIGKVGISAHEATCNQQINAIIPNNNVDSQALAYILLSRQAQMKELANAPIVPIINKTTFANIKVPLPPLDAQKKIADTLGKTQEIIDGHKKQLAELDNLIKAFFYEMFGDPVENNKNWRKVSLGEKIKVIGGYAFKSNEFSDDGIPVIKIGNINTGFFSDKGISYWNEDIKLAKYLVFPGDIVISLTGTVGKDDYANVCILPDYYPRYYLNQRNAKLELKDNINVRYLLYILKDKRIKGNLTGISRGIRQANISNKDILKLSIPFPDLDLQTKFAAIVTKIEEQKAIVKQAITESETLFNSLMSEYFD